MKNFFALKEELDNLLCEKYPSIFRERHTASMG
jgi:hypothetical protein